MVLLGSFVLGFSSRVRAEGRRESLARQHGDSKRDENYFLTSRHGRSYFSTPTVRFQSRRQKKCFSLLTSDTATDRIPWSGMICVKCSPKITLSDLDS